MHGLWRHYELNKNVVSSAIFAVPMELWDVLPNAESAEYVISLARK